MDRRIILQNRELERRVREQQRRERESAAFIQELQMRSRLHAHLKKALQEREPERRTREVEALIREFQDGYRLFKRGRPVYGQDILFAGLPFPLDPQARYPLLLESQGNDLEKQTFYMPLPQGNNLLKRMPQSYNIYEFYEKEVSPVSPVSDGWISLVDFKDFFSSYGASCSLLNTVTKQEIQMPRIKYKGDERGIKYYECVLSKSTADPQCVYIFFSASDVLWCRKGDAWFNISRHTGHTDYITTLINFKGTVYGLLGDSRNIVEVTFIGTEISFSPLINDQGQHCSIPNQASTGFLETDGYFIDCCGDLLFAQMLIESDDTNPAPKFEVFKVDIVSKECSRVNTIGERAVFVPGGMAVNCEEVPGIMKDTIYFLWLESMWSYNVGQGKITGKYDMPQSHLSWLII